VHCRGVSAHIEDGAGLHVPCKVMCGAIQIAKGKFGGFVMKRLYLQ